MVDLTGCDREPIHILGTTQPHGVLLALVEPALTVAQISDNVADHLAVDVETALGQPLDTLIDPASVLAVREALDEGRPPDPSPLPIEANGKRFDGIVHRYDGAAILELEPALGSAIGMHHPFRSVLVRVPHVATLPELADLVVTEMRRVTGFERVMLYRFHEDGHGSVEAEAAGPALEPYLGLHYPASDIPAQARRLYLQNWLRLIVDARATPARIVPTLRPDTGRPLDLSFAVLRSVSPIHLEYLANMGVRAAMSVSLVVGGRLWGLISCLDHSGPRRVSHELRVACEFLGRLTSVQIAALEDRELLAQRVSRRATEAELTTAMDESSANDCVLTALLARSEALLGLVSADGAAVMSAGGLVTCGRVPPRERIEAIAAWVDEHEGVEPFSTASLAAVVPGSETVSDVASGLLTFALPGSPPRRLLWFRPEIISTVRWGGDPGKPVGSPSGGSLRPRTSFAVWREEVRHRSKPWTESDLEAADELQRRAVMIDLERRLVNERRAVRARDDLLAVVSHDLRSPLAGIRMQAELMARWTAAGEVTERPWRAAVERIHRSTSMMLELVEDLLDRAKLEGQRFTLHPRRVECQTLLEQALASATPLAEAKRITMTVELRDALVLEVDTRLVLRVFANLIGNAIQFTPEGGTIAISAERDRDACRITVCDSGPGIALEHLPHVFDPYWQGKTTSPGAGLGLDIARGIVEAHGGRIWAEASPVGARLSFTVPLAA